MRRDRLKIVGDGDHGKWQGMVARKSLVARVGFIYIHGVVILLLDTKPTI